MKVMKIIERACRNFKKVYNICTRNRTDQKMRRIVMRYNGVFESQKMNQVNNGGVKNPTVLPAQGFVCGAFGRQFYVFL